MSSEIREMLREGLAAQANRSFAWWGFSNDCHDEKGEFCSTGGPDRGGLPKSVAAKFASTVPSTAPGGGTIELVKNTAKNGKDLLKESKAQGIEEMNPINHVLGHSGATHVLVHRDPEGKINGALGVSYDKTGDLGAIDFRVGTDKNQERQGVGTALMTRAAQLAMTTKDQELNHYGSVGTAIPFYQKLGAEYRLNNDRNGFNSSGTMDKEATKALAEGKPIDKRTPNPRENKLDYDLLGNVIGHNHTGWKDYARDNGTPRRPGEPYAASTVTAANLPYWKTVFSNECHDENGRFCEGSSSSSSSSSPLVGNLSALSAKNQDAVHEALAKVPADVQKILANAGVKVVAYPEVKRGAGKGSLDYGGMYDGASHEVQVSNKGFSDSASREHDGDANFVLHELGHAMDQALGYPSKMPAFRAIWKDAEPKSGSYFQKTLGGTDPRGEMLAEAYAHRWEGSSPKEFTMTEHLKTIVDQLRHNVKTGRDLSIVGIQFANQCHDENGRFCSEGGGSGSESAGMEQFKPGTTEAAVGLLMDSFANPLRGEPKTVAETRAFLDDLIKTASGGANPEGEKKYVDAINKVFPVWSKDRLEAEKVEQDYKNKVENPVVPKELFNKEYASEVAGRQSEIAQNQLTTDDYVRDHPEYELERAYTSYDEPWLAHADTGESLTQDEMKGLADKFTAENEEVAAQLVGRSDVCIRMQPSALTGFLQSGEFRTFHSEEGQATSISNHEGGNSTEDRRRIEDEYFGGESYPVYGYLSDDRDGFVDTASGHPMASVEAGLSFYGDISMKLNDDVKERATYTLGDSSALHGDQPVVAPQPVLNPGSVAGAHFADLHGVTSIREAVLRNFGKTSYFESQIHGGVKPSDVREIVFAYKPPVQMQNLLKEKGVAWRSIDKEDDSGYSAEEYGFTAAGLPVETDPWLSYIKAHNAWQAAYPNQYRNIVKPSLTASVLPSWIVEFINECHDERGRFCEGEGAGSGSSTKDEYPQQSKLMADPSMERISPPIVARLEEQGKKWADGLSPEEQAAVNSYTGGGYRDINNRLADMQRVKDKWSPESGEDIFDRNDIQDDTDRKTALLDDALAKAPDLSSPVVTYRGVALPGMSQEQVAAYGDKEFPVGKEIGLAQGGFQSSSVGVEPALDASLGEKNNGIVFEIQASKGAYLQQLSHFDDEHEFLMPRQSRFEVVRVLHDVPYIKGESADEVNRGTVVQVRQVK